MDFTTILNQGLALGQSLSFATGNVPAIVLTSIAQTAANIIEAFYGSPDGDQQVVKAITQMGSDIDQHINDLYNELSAELKDNAIAQQNNVLDSMVRELSTDQATISGALNAAGGTKSQDTSSFTVAVKLFQQHVTSATGGGSALDQALAFSINGDNCGKSAGYATLPLLMATTLFYANYLKYASTVQTQLEAIKKLQKLNRGGSPPEPNGLPDNQQGLALALNIIIYQTLQATFNVACPLVQNLNAAVTQRQSDASTAASGIQVQGSGDDCSLQPSVSLSETPSDQNDPEDDYPYGSSDMGFVAYGYGQGLSARNAQLFAMLANAQRRRTSWVNSTVNDKLYLLDCDAIMKLNYCLHSIWNSMTQYYGMIPTNTASPLSPPGAWPSGLYLPPPSTSLQM